MKSCSERRRHLQGGGPCRSRSRRCAGRCGCPPRRSHAAVGQLQVEFRPALVEATLLAFGHAPGAHHETLDGAVMRTSPASAGESCCSVMVYLSGSDHPAATRRWRRAARHAPGQVGEAGDDGVLHGSPIITGSWAWAMAVFINTASQPSSMAMVASQRSTPASTSTGTLAFEDDAQVVGVADAQARADQAGQGHNCDAAHLGQLAGDDGVVAGVDHHVETFLDQHFGGLEGLDHVGEEGLWSARTSSLTRLCPSSSSRARRQGTASTAS